MSYVIYNNDCMKVMADTPNEYFDLIITDPPYNISKLNDVRDRSKLNSPIMRRKKAVNYDFGEWDHMERQEFLDFTDSWLQECIRVLKTGGTIISFFNKADVNYLGWQAKKYGVRTRTYLSWHKTNPTPSFRKVNYLSATEFIWVGSKGDKAWTFNFGKQSEMHNFFETPNSSIYGKTAHPTEKPLVLIEHLIKIHSNKGDQVFDPFMGSGTALEACVRLNRFFIGAEINPDYCKMAEDRVKQQTMTFASKTAA